MGVIIASMSGLNLFWNDAQSWYVTAVEALDPNWKLIRTEAEILPFPHMEYGVTKTLPLKLYSSGQEFFTTATASGDQHAIDRGLTFIRILGHVWPEPPRQPARSLKQYLNPFTKQYLLCASVESEVEAIEKGYEFIRTEGWAAPTPVYPLVVSRSRSEFGETNDQRNLVTDPEYQWFGGGSLLATRIYWGQLAFGDPLHDRGGGGFTARNRDVIVTSEEQIESNVIEFVLELGPQVTWWKGITLRNRQNQVLASRETEGGRGQVSMRFPTREFVGGVLEFSKAKFLGEHLSQYLLIDLTAKTGKRVTFRWVRDDEDTNRPSLALQDLEETLPHGDLIRVAVGSGDPSFMTVVLNASNRATWWKQVKLLHPDRSEGPSVSTQDDRHGPERIQIPNGELAGGRLLLSKAMTAGVHTDIYEIGDLTGLAGRTITLEWLRDNLPDPYAQTVLEWRAGFRFDEEHWGLRDFSGVRADGDIITPTVEDLGSNRQNEIELVIATAGNVTWWKALRLFNIFDNLVTEVFVEGANQRSQSIVGRFEELWGANLVFAKAKFLGRHEDKYEYQLTPSNLQRIGAAPGKRIIFIWSADNLPRPTNT